MSDYISRDELLELYTLDGPMNETGVVHLPIIRQNIMDMPAADVAPVRHGRWLTTDAYPHRLYCSVCYKTYAKNMKWVDELELPTKFCPECGALMDGKEDGTCWGPYTKEENMDKPLNAWTLGEAAECCEKYIPSNCNGCPIKKGDGMCSLEELPDRWFTQSKPQFDYWEKRKAESLLDFLPNAEKISREADGNLKITTKYGYVVGINRSLFPSIKNSCTYSLKEIIGTENADN